MAKFLSLITFTDQGIRNVKDSTTRAEHFRRDVEAVGGKVQAAYWTLGDFDGCVLLEAPDEETATAAMLRLGQQGNVRTRTMRLYDEEEFQEILAKV